MNSAEQSPAELRLRRAWEAGLGISFGPTRALYDLDVRAMRHGRGASLFTRTCAGLACGVLAELVFADGERGLSENAEKIAECYSTFARPLPFSGCTRDTSSVFLAHFRRSGSS